MEKSSISIYIHWPFCLSKCPYCDFNSYVCDNIEHEVWKNAYKKEILYFADTINHKYIKSIFFGGGTPSLMKADMIEAIIDNLSLVGKIDNDTEITLEANPTSIEMDKFHSFKAVGINRISCGIQSIDDASLKFLGRAHDAKTAIRAIEISRQIFKKNSFDMMYALPFHTINNWEIELRQILELVGEHISLYQLTIEKGTKFYTQYKNKKFKELDKELETDLYELTNQMLESHNYIHYEISNYAKQGYECVHNLSYWNYDDYLGLGAGSHSRISYFCDRDRKWKMQAINMIKNPKIWSRGDAIECIETLTEEQVILEILLMGLRLKSGIDDNKIRKYTSMTFEDIVNQETIQNLKQYMTLDKNYIKLTAKGLLLQQQIVSVLHNSIII